VRRGGSSIDDMNEPSRCMMKEHVKTMNREMISGD
jgi:hypothetical protein